MRNKNLAPAVRLVLSIATAVALVTPATAQSPDEFFEAEIRPLLAEKCYTCHARMAMGGLRLNSRAAMLEGGDMGPAIVPGSPDDSLLMAMVRHEIPGMEMPKDRDPLAADEIAALAEWIRMDAPWPNEAPTAVTVANEGLTPSARIFVDRVRPLLAQKCYACHTDSEEGGLRLDSRNRILAGGGRGPAIIPGNPEESLLIAAVRHADQDLQMPRNGDRLSDAEIRGLVDWIASGADWAEVEAPMVIPRRAISAEERDFWSFQPLATPAVPTPATAGWARTDIDRFVLAKLEDKGLTPVGDAEKRQLIRRATFDLIGLPPTPEEVEAFLDDDSADAFEKVVDRLLASPHYGERWGRHWLDVVRYGEDDTRTLAPSGNGRETYPSAYVYRDWVVDALNEDLPYDVFAMAQIAGDLMEEKQRTLGGVGFLGIGPWYYDIANPATARADERHDRVDVTTRGFLGLTVGCARCHDHKYDPIGTHDYYALASVFYNTNYYEYPVADEDEAEAYKKDKEFIEGLSDGLNEYLSTESDQLARVLTLQISRYMMAAWRVTGEPQIPVERAAAQAKLDLETLERWIYFLAKEPRHYPYLVDWQEMIATDGGTEERAQELADEFQRLVLEIVAEREKLEERNRKIIAKGTSLEEVKSTPMPNGFESFFDEHQLELETLDRERFNLFYDVFIYDLDNQLDTFFPRPALLRFNNRSWGLERRLSRVAADHVAATRAEIEELEEELPDFPFVMGVQDKPEEDIEDIGLHIRGSPTNLGEKVPRGFLHVLADDPRPYTDGSGRMELAKDIATHPLAARVIVNRVWNWHMGTGIVNTPSNFGFAGERPSNPDLLEHLASWFVDNGMSLKKLHRKIMLSRVYQLDTGQVPANEATDPENFYYWRANRRRLDAEGIRDALLAVSGNLDREIGGPAVQLADEDNDRRTIYGFVSRFELDEYLQIFDFPNPSLTAERRFSTNVPLQSLFFMNSDLVTRQAELLVKRLAKETGPDAATAAHEGNDTTAAADEDDDTTAADDDIPHTFDDEAMMARAYRLLYAREVTAAEKDAGLEFLAEQRVSLLEKELAALAEAEDEAAAQEDPQESTGAENQQEDEPDPQLAAERRAAMKAWVQYARALFSASEFRYLD